MIQFPEKRAFCDTSFFFAALYPKDVNYDRADEILRDALQDDFSRLGLTVIS